MRRLVFAISALCVCAGLSAQTFTTSIIPRDPASLALAGADAASPEHLAWTAFGNASVAALNSQKAALGVSYTMWSPSGQKTNIISAGASAHIGRIVTLSLAGSFAPGQTYSVIDDEGISQGEFTTNSQLFGAALSVKLGAHGGLGVGVRYGRESLAAEYNLSGVMIDASFAWDFDFLTVSAGVKSLGPKAKLGDNSYDLPSSGNLALYAPLSLGLNHTLSLAADADYFFGAGFAAAGGVQYGFKNMVFARAGYHYGSSKAPLPQYASLGLGVKFFGVSLDVAWLTANTNIGNTIQAGLSYCF